MTIKDKIHTNAEILLDGATWASIAAGCAAVIGLPYVPDLVKELMGYVAALAVFLGVILKGGGTVSLNRPSDDAN